MSLFKQKTIILLILTSSLISTATVAQEWSLFSFDQKMFFTNSVNNERDIDYYQIDSLRVNQDENIYYFLMNYRPDNFYESCDYQEFLFDNMFDGFEGEYLFNLHDFYLDSIVVRNDTVFYERYGQEPFFFIPKAALGDSWSIYTPINPYEYDTLTITCDSIYLDTFFGIVDSVKNFRVNTNHEDPESFPNNEILFKLSKNYGFLEFVPFRYMLYDFTGYYESSKLLGIDSAGVEYGFRYLDFDDYFGNVSSGDILFWHRMVTNTYIYEPNESHYIRDSITAVEYGQDTITYIFNRVTLSSPDWTYTYQYDLKREHPKEVFNVLIKSPPKFPNRSFDYSTIMYDDNRLVSDNYNQYEITIDDNEDTIVKRSFGDYHSIDTLGCEISYGMQYIRSSMTLSSSVGIVSYGWVHSDGSNDRTRLLGYRIGDKTHGDTDFITSVQLNDIDSKFHLYPNPTTNQLFVEVNDIVDPNFRLELFNVMGKLVLTQHTTQNLTILDLGRFDSGIYFLNIHSDDKVFTKKIIKQ